MSAAPVLCVVCESKIDYPVIAPCLEGHYHCQLCLCNLNGNCKICSAPVQEEAVVADTFIEVVPDTLYALDDVQKLWNPLERPSSNVIIEYYENVLDVIEAQDTELAVSCINEDASLIKSVSSLNLGYAHPNDVSSSLMEILKDLHEHTCSKSCTTFDDCIRQALYQQFDLNKKQCRKTTTDYDRDYLSDVLLNCHQTFCEKKCKNVEKCLSSTLKDIIEEQTTNAKDILQVIHPDGTTTRISSKKGIDNKKSTEKSLPEADNKCATFIDERSNVTRASFPKDNHEHTKSIYELPQFESITTFPTSSKKSQVDFTLPFFFESNSKFAKLVECPLLECNTSIEDCYLTKHFLDKHALHNLCSLQSNECSLFFIDPSTLECNQMKCVASFIVPKVFSPTDDTYMEENGLPIFVMACRVTSEHLFSGKRQQTLSDTGSSMANNKSSETDLNEAMDADIAETVYGIRKKPGSGPVKWTFDDMLIICPVAPIPKKKAVRTCMTAFLPKNISAKLSMSFCMRPLRDLTTMSDLLGCPDTMCLTSQNIDTLTTGGQHAIHCQILCKF